ELTRRDAPFVRGGDRLDAAVGMSRKAGEIVLRSFVPEVVEEEKRVIVRRGAEAERAPEPHAGSLQRRLGFDQSRHRADGHRALLVSGPSARSVPRSSADRMS